MMTFHLSSVSHRLNMSAMVPHLPERLVSTQLLYLYW